MDDISLKLVKELRHNTLEKIVDKFGTGIGELSHMKLSIWDVRDILYDEAKKIAKIEFNKAKKELDKELEKW